MNRHIDEIEFTIFDTETTGLEPQLGDRIVEIAGLRFKGSQTIGTFQTLINPRRPISAAAFQVNKITPQMLQDAPDTRTAIPEFLKFIQGSCLCSYNAAFDIEFLNNELKLINQSPLNDIMAVDVLKMAKRLLPDLERYALWFVAHKLGLSAQQKHRAFSDVELTFDVFNKLKGMLQAKGVFDFMDFVGLFGINSVSSSDLNNQRIAKIQEAIELGARLKIRYLSGSQAEVTEREVVPKEIKKEKNRVYLVGHCCLRNQERSFRIDGILHLEIV